MAAPDVTKAVLGSGRLAYGCTDLTAAWPHGGTGLGMCSNVVLVYDPRYSELIAEETNSPAAVLFCGGSLRLAGFLEQWDDDAVAAVFPSTATAVSGRKVIQVPGSGLLPGETVTALSSLVFTSRNSTHPSVLLYSAAPMVKEAAEVQLSAYRYMRLPFVFLGLPNGSDNVASIGRLADLSL